VPRELAHIKEGTPQDQGKDEVSRDPFNDLRSEERLKSFGIEELSSSDLMIERRSFIVEISIQSNDED
jgi:hypothetical protein